MRRREAARPREWLLAIRLRQLGDVLATLEVLRALKRHRPERAIAFVADRPYDGLLDSVDYIDRVLPPPRGRNGMRAWVDYIRDIRRLRPSAAIDFHGSARSSLLALASGAPIRVGFDVRVRRLAYTVVEPRGEWSEGRRVPHPPIAWGMRLARHLGAAAADPLPPRLTVSEPARDAGRTALEASGVPARAIEAGTLLGLNPGRPTPSKSWPPGRFVELARSLVAEGSSVVVLWGPGERDTAQSIAREAGSGVFVAPPLALREIPAVLAALGALVTIDSGLKHLAVCLRVPTVTLFGSTDPGEWHMGTDLDSALWRGLSCSPCRRATCPFGTPCMDIPPETVRAEVRRIEGARAA